MWPDNETDLDFLNFCSVSDTVAEIIVQAQRRPISIGVSGAWGVGKSSMIRLTRRSLERRAAKDGRNFLFVEFNAWLYQGYDDARAALMEVIAQSLKAKAEELETGVEKVAELIRRVDWLRVVKLTAGSAAALAFGLPPVGLIGEIFQLGKKAAAGSVDEKAIGDIQDVGSQIETAATGLLKPKPDSSPPKEIDAIRKNFEEALEELDVTLVVLIDDLDRCLPATTISTLEAIRLFLFLKNTAFVIAADNDMIKHAVRRHFEGVDDKLVISYFDKLIQVPIQVPPLGTQEVRAYMMLLFVENSTLDQPTRETIRARVCQQLGLTWKGKRVDRAFMQSLGISFSSELTAQFDTADRLAPLMTTASQIAGNPRLIKRFLNALSIRLAISKANGIGVDEAALAKMLLFERCGSTQAYADLLKKVNENESGKPAFLAEWESAAQEGKTFELQPPWNDDFVKEWLTIPPALADMDLRGILYVSREHSPLITPEDRLSSSGAELLVALLEHPDMGAELKDRLTALPRPETTVIMDRLLERARQVQEWGVPPILEACLAVSRADPAQGSRLGAFLTDRPPGQIKASIVPKIADEPWAEGTFGHWESSSGVSGPVKKAIKERRQKHGNVTV